MSFFKKNHEVTQQQRLLNALKHNNVSNARAILSQSNDAERLQLITVEVYQLILKTTSEEKEQLLREAVEILRNSNSDKHKALISYPLIEQAIKDMDCSERKKKRILKHFRKISLDELLTLNLFMQFNPSNNDMAHYFKGGLFAVNDNGKLYDYYRGHIECKNRRHDCSHLSTDDQHSSQGKFIPEFLFGTRDINTYNDQQQYSDSNRNYTCWQTEYASLFGQSTLDSVMNYLKHKICFVVYFFSKKNVGPYSLSEFKENNIRILDPLQGHEDYAPKETFTTTYGTFN